jgi:3-methylfumaryl-CoA hydratase
MTTAAELIEASLPELQAWIGRREVVEDEIAVTTVRRIAAMLDKEPGRFVPGTELPPHWFTLFFTNNALQRDIGPDGHPRKGIFLPPIPLPRRMAAGRRARIMGTLRAAELARRVAEVVAITPKIARTGPLVVLTMRHTISVAETTIAIEDFDAVYREALAPGVKNALAPPLSPPTDATWSQDFELSNALVFRYSAITWNAHRIHYDADYARREEGYPDPVQNGGLTLQLIIDAALPHLPGRLTGFEARLTRPLWVGGRLTVAGRLAREGALACWGADRDGHLCASVTLEHAA